MKKLMFIFAMLIGAAPVCANPGNQPSNQPNPERKSDWQDFKETFPVIVAGIESAGDGLKVAGKFAYENSTLVSLSTDLAYMAAYGSKNKAKEFLNKNGESLKNGAVNTISGLAALGVAGLGAYGLYQHPGLLTAIPACFWSAGKWFATGIPSSLWGTGKWLVQGESAAASFARFAVAFSVLEAGARSIKRKINSNDREN